MKMNKTLLEQAKDIKVRRKDWKPSEEEVELLLAWLNDDINSAQLTKVVGCTGATGLYRIATWVRWLYRSGRLAISNDTKIRN